MVADEFFPWGTSSNIQLGPPQEGHEAALNSESTALVHPSNELNNSTTSHLGKRRRGQPEQYLQAEAELPTAKRHLQSMYIPVPHVQERDHKNQQVLGSPQ